MTPIWQQDLGHGSFVTTNELPDEAVATLKQIHSSRVILWQEQITRPKADGLVCLFPISGPFAIYTADCLPICIEGNKGVALLHAGWRGLQQNILGHSLVKSIQPNIIAIGPAINSAHYEVGEEFASYFPESSALTRRKNGKLHFCLIEEAERQIYKLYPKAQLYKSSICTWSHPELRSFRRGGGPERNFNIYFPRSS